MTNVQAYSMDVNLVVEAMRDNAELYSELLFESWRRLQSNISQLENMTLKSALKKVAHGLTFLSNEFGIKETSGMTLQLPMVYQDLASIFGLTRETVARSMSSLKSQGLVSIDRERRISVPDVEALQVIYK
jgi:CRP/FNR family transcriptional regulator